MTINKYIILGVSLLLTFALGFIGGLYLKKPQIISNPVPIYVKGKDSLVIEKHYYIVHDTVKAEVKDEVAYGSFNTAKVIDKDTIKIKSDVRYSLSDSTFNLDQFIDLVHVKEIRIDTIKIKVPIEKIVYKDVPIWKKPLVMYVSGIITAILIFFLSGGG